MWPLASFRKQNRCAARDTVAEVKMCVPDSNAERLRTVFSICIVNTRGAELICPLLNSGQPTRASLPSSPMTTNSRRARS